MRLYLYSLGVGALVGLIYGVLGVKSPALPVVALLGLLGMLGGEQLGTLIAQWRTPARSIPATRPTHELAKREVARPDG